MTDARVGVDVGGTFTDVVVARDGTLVVWKVPTTTDQSAGFERGVSEALDRAGAPPVALIAHGTTVATNAVLERRGARTALLTTDGFRDVLAIGRQTRPALYDLTARRPDPLVERSLSFGVPERVGRDGVVLIPLDETAARDAIARAVALGAESVAVCLLFSFANPDHELRIRDLLRAAAPGVRASLSHEVLPEFREYERASTTALDAYVAPVVEGYLQRIRERAGHLAPIVVMRSGGGTMSAAAAEPVHTLLSGPAAGVRGAAFLAQAAGYGDVVSFDMGGTSTDVCLIEDGEPALGSGSSIGGLPFRTPSLAVHTIGAGGGSILWADEAGVLRAGPRSAGASPGPACYGGGGLEATVTDAHLVLGHLDPERFLGGRMRLDPGAATSAIEDLAARLGANPGEVSRAGLAVARAQMAAAIRVVTVERGRDPRAFALVAFGGAGPMYGTALAADLEMTTVLIPAASGALSALGLLATPLTGDSSLTRPMTDPSPREAAEVLAVVEERAVERLRAQGAEPAAIVRAIDCRYRGQAHEVTVVADDLHTLTDRFAAQHRARFGWDAPGEAMEAVTFRARAEAAPPRLALPLLEPGTGARPSAHRPIALPDGPADIPAYDRAALRAGDRIAGPCILDGDDSTALVDPGWDGEVDRTGTIVLRRG